MNPTNVSLDNTADLIKSSSTSGGSDAPQTDLNVSELSIQLHNEQRLRQRLEERLKTLEQAAAQASAQTASNITTVNATPVAPQSAQPPSVAPTTGPPANLLPTQPLKMEVVAAVAAEKQQQTTASTVVKTVQPPTISARPPPGTILLADKNGMQVKVEAVHGLPTVRITLCENLRILREMNDGKLAVLENAIWTILDTLNFDF